MCEMIKACFFYTKHAAQSQSCVNDSLKVISVNFLSPREQETETGERGTYLKIDRESEMGTECKEKLSGNLMSETAN